MLIRFSTLLLVVFSFTYGCSTGQTHKKQRPLAIDNGKIFNHAGKKLLYGGKQEYQHFDISNCDLNDNQFHYGLGREGFPALLEQNLIPYKKQRCTGVTTIDF